MLKLSDEQQLAAASQKRLTYLEAPPGSGKTCVAAERFGVVAHAGLRSQRGRVLAVSFARSATAELRTRITRRWGISATRWPNRVQTIDSFHKEVLEFLLRSGHLSWPGKQKELQLIESWRGHKGARQVERGKRFCKAFVKPDHSVWTTGGVRQDDGWAFTTVGPIRALLAEGIATPEEVRELLGQCLAKDCCRAAIESYFVATTDHILIDEVFDANPIDLGVVGCAVRAGCGASAIGDPWQAIYAWRGADPQHALQWLKQAGFEPGRLTHSYRFANSPSMRQLEASMRRGDRLDIPTIDKPDVVLASKWRTLWEKGSSVLPLSFGRPQNMTDAALVLLLSQVTAARIGQPALFVREANMILRIESDASAQSSHLAPVINALQKQTPHDESMKLLREAVVALGAKSRPRRISKTENRHIQRLDALSKRLASSSLVPGMTTFQAKGLEWDSVEVCVSADEALALASGLDQQKESDRVLYVALTRSRKATGIAR